MPQTISEAMINGTLGHMTQPPADPLPWYLDMAENIPKLTASAGVKAFRGSGTILGGGSGANIGRGGWVREGMRQANYLRPRNWRQFGTQDYFHHQGALNRPLGPTESGKRLRKTTYNPFYASAGINAIGRGLGGDGKGRVSGWLAKSSVGKSLVERGYVGHGRELVAKGFYSRVTAAGRMGWMSNRQFGKSAGNAYNFLQGAGYTADSAQSVLKAGKTATQAAVLTSGAGTLSGRVGGFLAGASGPIDKSVLAHLHRTAKFGDTAASRAGARASLKGQEIARRWAGETGEGAAKKALKTTGKGAAAKVVGKRAALLAGRVALTLNPLTGPAMLMWFAWDIAKLSVKGAGYAARLGVEGMKSFEGGMRTGIMEQGFTDTEATMTSRARGVHAIQNSRLNARGVLGSEAGAMHSHFG